METNLHFSGSLTAKEYPDLRRELLEALESAHVLRVHLWAVVEVDEASVAALMDIRRAAEACRRLVCFVDTSPAVLLAFQTYPYPDPEQLPR